MTDITMDWEFLDMGRTVYPISVGLATHGRVDYYAVNASMPWQWVLENEWLRQYVVPYLPLCDSKDKDFDTPRLNFNNELVKPQQQIAAEIEQFVLQFKDPQIWCYYGAYDWMCLGSMYGRMMNLPKGFPKWFHEIMQLWESRGKDPALKPPHLDMEHHALADARWNLEFLLKLAAE